MARLDERLKRDLERAGRPADPSGVYEHLIRRRERRRIAKKVQSGLLAVFVVAGSAAGVYGLSIVFGGGADRTPLGLPAGNGLLAIAVQEERTGHMNIFTIAPDGTGLTRLTSGPELDVSVAWAPDGRSIAFWRTYPEEPSGIWLAEADGAEAHPILETQLSIGSIAWSPDGSRIAFVGIELPEGGGTELDFDTRLYVMNADGTGVAPITTEGQVSDFAWSPEGDRFVIERQYGVGDDRLGYSLSVMNADGTGETPLTSDDVSADPSWSPDGASIVFVRGAGRTGRDLFAVSPDGSGLRRLTDDEAVEEGPVWSPDGARIAVARFPNGDGGACELVVMGADGSGPTTIADKTSLGGCPVSIAWQPIIEPAEVSPEPSASPTPTVSPADDRITDIGLGLLLCDVTGVTGTFVDGPASQTAFVGAEPNRADGCRRVVESEFAAVAAIDLSGDGVADIASEPFDCQYSCRTLASPDVDGDGTDELLAVNVGFSIAGVRLFDVVPDEDQPRLVAVAVEPPGDAALGYQGFDGSGPPQFWIGGDGFGLDALRCEPTSAGRVLISTTAQMVPPDAPDSVWQVHETTFELERGVLRVIEARDFEVPVDPGETPSFMSTAGCGANINA